MRVRAGWPALTTIGVVWVGALIDGNPTISTLSEGIINSTEAQSLRPEYAEIVRKFYMAKDIKSEEAASNIFDLETSQGRTKRAIYEEPRAARWHRTACSGEIYIGKIGLFRQVETNPNFGLCFDDERLRMPSICNTQSYREGAQGLDGKRLDTQNVDIKRGALALNEGPSLNETYASEAERKSSNPPSESNHPVWISKGSFPKSLLRFYVLLATLALSMAALVIVNSPHVPSWIATIGFGMSFGTPPAMFLALLSIG